MPKAERSAPRRDAAPIDQLVRRELRTLRAEVPGVGACLVATSDGRLVAEDAPDLEAPQTAALTSR